MLIDADEFCQDVLDTSYGYASSNHMSPCKWSACDQLGSGFRLLGGRSSAHFTPHLAKWAANLDKSTKISISESLHSISSTSFLRTELNSLLPENFAVEVAVRAGCSSDAVEMARNFEGGPTGIDDLLPKMSENDAALLSAQLDREIKSEWKSSSLLGRLGVDEPGLAPCDSILRMYDLLCNINFQLLVMQRELLKHESVVRVVRGTKDATACGFEDINNKAQLGRLIHSLDISSASLRDRIESLSRALFEDTWKPEKKTNELSYYVLPACFAVLTLGWLIVRMNVVGIK